MAAYVRLRDVAGQAKVMLAQANLMPEHRVPLLRSAANLLDSGPLALVALRALSEAAPDDQQVWIRLARIERSLGEKQSARASLIRAARVAFLPAERASLLLEAAELSDSLSESPQARQLRAEARRADPGHAEALRQSLADLRLERSDELPVVLQALIEVERSPGARIAYRRELVELL